MMAMPSPSSVLPSKQRIRHAFDQAATTYDAAADVQREVSDRLAGYLALLGNDLDPVAILDAGCGTGYGARWLQQQWPCAGLTLVDFAPRMLLATRTPLTEVALICADIEALPVAAHRFDLYWSSLAWQWNDPQRCLAEAARVLKPRGWLAVATLGADNFPELRHAFADTDDYSHALTIPAPEQLLAHCQAGGWTVRVWHRQSVRRHYPELRSLLRSVKAVGAREVGQRRPTPFSRSAWQAITARYEQLRESAGLPLSYDAVWLIATL
ncbi:malonyl-ACP O-methyltransferase BioC [Candidatus Contendibacter odensensis]|uniref:Malonyl-[acyl-carrier protein] O-methyltransferase n=1 Tax=Candidatus Contendobacter odensis Run_B_J11 TaxID=1400861 RepID=A0A7U7GDD9_9GAMM|nr:malonyl-ACP O-methyltransferase BioC [Candidatus Contendobacter odensis]CDH46346.1 putative Malonyl-CoA O-methyltransferase BioC [Candidatus Contendobacter odensis Run_B_J11]